MMAKISANADAINCGRSSKGVCNINQDLTLKLDLQIVVGSFMPSPGGE